MSEAVLSEAERKALLEEARRSIAHTLGVEAATDERAPAIGAPQLKAGAFVSLHKSGALRGCIGTFETDRPVVDQVRDMAIAAATRDPRFPPVSSEEMAELDIEISVLTQPRTISTIDEIVVGTHGLVIAKGHRRGVLLPQVASEYGWDRETFLSHTCRKAGLPEQAWRDKETSIQVFSAEVFGEH